ncbi:hypothetical protein AGMMS50268_00950 [Spirochaetia bacterium]|nr:hypothetical protein AGMMS50268_00950 [Spirochaetia bacterium]
MDGTSEISPFPDPDYNAYKEKLKYDSAKDVLRTDSGVFVRFTYPVTDIRRIDYSSGLVNGEPLWIHNRTSEASGYMLAVGSSGRQRYIKETITKSYESAIAALLAQKSVDIKTKDVDSSRDGSGTELREVIEGELIYFHILEIWIDPKTQNVWTLAAAKKG